MDHLPGLQSISCARRSASTDKAGAKFYKYLTVGFPNGVYTRTFLLCLSVLTTTYRKHIVVLNQDTLAAYQESCR